MSLSSPHWQAVLCHQRLLGSLLRTCKSPCFSYCSFALALCCPEVFLAKQAAVSPEAACANPLCLHTASGPAWEPQAAPPRLGLSRLQRLECGHRRTAWEQGLGPDRAAEVTARVTASQTGTGGQPLPSSPSWSSWGTSAPRPLGFGARRPPGSWPLPLESWSPPPRLMRARLPRLCGERPPHSGGRAGETMEEAVSGSPGGDPEDRARPASGSWSAALGRRS